MLSSDSNNDASPGGGSAVTDAFPPAIRVLLVDQDSSAREAADALLRDEGYVCATATTCDEALELLRASEFHLIVCDVTPPHRDGPALLDRLRAEQPATAAVMLTPAGDTAAAVECLKRGAADALVKPPKPTDLVRAVERALGKRRLELARLRYRTSLEIGVREKTAELSCALREVESAYSSTLATLVAALDAREQETSDHSQRVVRYALAIAERLGVPAADQPDIARGALLHDIGKIGVPDAILLKPTRLLEHEWFEMRKHPEIGFTILQPIPFLRVPAEIVLSHHENWDGSGYPRGLAGDAIPLGARIFAIADTLDAITSDRPYRQGAPIEKARAEVARWRGVQFDPECVDAFLSIDPETFESLRLPDLRRAAAG